MGIAGGGKPLQSDPIFLPISAADMRSDLKGGTGVMQSISTYCLKVVLPSSASAPISG